nr:hypothetical protein GCM10020185_77820 [Pseudomonas brassicacearum subsp. brassicacearum]
MIGTPQEIIERIKYYQELGVDEFSFWCDNSLPHAEKKKIPGAVYPAGGASVSVISDIAIASRLAPT